MNLFDRNLKSGTFFSAIFCLLLCPEILLAHPGHGEIDAAQPILHYAFDPFHVCQYLLAAIVIGGGIWVCIGRSRSTHRQQNDQ